MPVRLLEQLLLIFTVDERGNPEPSRCVSDKLGKLVSRHSAHLNRIVRLEVSRARCDQYLIWQTDCIAKICKKFALLPYRFKIIKNEDKRPVFRLARQRPGKIGLGIASLYDQTWSHEFGKIARQIFDGQYIWSYHPWSFRQ